MLDCQGNGVACCFHCRSTVADSSDFRGLFRTICRGLLLNAIYSATFFAGFIGTVSAHFEGAATLIPRERYSDKPTVNSCNLLPTNLGQEFPEASRKSTQSQKSRKTNSLQPTDFAGLMEVAPSVPKHVTTLIEVCGYHEKISAFD